LSSRRAFADLISYINKLDGQKLTVKTISQHTLDVWLLVRRDLDGIVVHVAAVVGQHALINFSAKIKMATWMTRRGVQRRRFRGF
jgi:hypothetical protein